MPVTYCPKHGYSGIDEMCHHLYRRLKRGVYQPFFEVPVITTRLCSTCFDKYNIEDLLKSADIPVEIIKEFREKLKGTDEIEQPKDWYNAVLKHPDKKALERARIVYDKVMKNRGFKCINCIDEIYIRYARRKNLKLPFEPFEKTLFTEEYDDKNVLALEKRLNKLFNSSELPWRDLNIEYNIEGGTYRKLFAIEIFGVESEPEQEAVIKAVEAFYKRKKRKQRRLIFNSEWKLVSYYEGEKKIEKRRFEFLREIVVK